MNPSRHKISSSIACLAMVAFGILSSCGQSSDTVVEYYIEDDDKSGNALPGEDGATDDAGNDDAGSDGGNGGRALSFVSPTQATDGGGTLSVVVSFTNVATDATWNLYYATKADAKTGTAIAEDLPVDTTSVDWDTATLAPGTYYLYATLVAGGETTRHPATAPITIAEDGDTPNAKPQIKITVPNGEEVFVAGTPQQVTFTGQDADGDALKYKVEYSPDGGTTWTVLADAITATTYDWNVAGLAQGINYRVRVSVDDGKGGTASVVSAKSFGVATQPVTFAAGFGAMLQQRCGNCHATGRVNAGQFRSDNYDLANIGVNDKTNNIKNRIDAGTMPPAGPLGAADKALLTMWFWGGSL